MNSRKGAADEIQRLEWLLRIRSAVMVVEFIMMVLLAALALYLGTLPKTVPWVVELTEDGEATYREDVVAALAAWSPSDATKRYFISHYISDMRSVSTDDYINKENANSVYSRSVDRATEAVGRWYSENNPVKRSKYEYTQIPLSDMAVVAYTTDGLKWKVTWRENTYRLSDRQITASQQIEAIITVQYYLPDTERRRRENPIGLYISDIETIYERSVL